MSGTLARGRGAPGAPAGGEDRSDVLEQLLQERHSCRGYLSIPVPTPILERILTLAQRTASWCNSQSWQVIVTRGAGTERFRAALHRHAASRADPAPDFPFPEAWAGVYLGRRRESGLQLYDACGIARGDRAASAAQGLENVRFFGAPHVAIVTTERALGVYGAVDCGGYVSSFMLAARSLGVASIAQAAIAAHSGFVHRYFGLPERRRVVCGISFGFEDEAHKANGFRTTRAPIEEVVTWMDE